MAERSSTAILRRWEVEGETGLRRSTLYARISEGLFPEPVLIGPRATGWPLGDVQAICRARISGVDDEGLRRLVKSLHAARRAQAAEQTAQARG